MSSADTAEVAGVEAVKHVVRRSSKVHVHDENNECNEGDVISIVPCRPMSKTKSWRLHTVVTRAR